MIQKKFPGHNEQIVHLKRIEGQIRGIRNMIESGEYCVDIINQVNAATQALHRVSEKIFERHLQTCVGSALTSRSTQQRSEKINEVLNIIRRMKK
ncbi:MAG: metal-sensitive transcriptional regulator [Candidatus Omnitrophota bacterium]